MGNGLNVVVWMNGTVIVCLMVIESEIVIGKLCCSRPRCHAGRVADQSNTGTAW